MLLKADLTVGDWEMAGTVQPSFSANSKAADDCPIEARCVVRPGLVAIEKADEVLDIAGGSHLLTNLTLPIVPWNCKGPEKRCSALVAPAAQHRLFGSGGTIRVTLHLYADGERILTCAVDPIDLPYLIKVGWSTVACKDAVVRRGPLI